MRPRDQITTTATVGIAFVHIRAHLRLSRQRMLTKYTIRILLMPVIYGTEAWAALRYSQHAVPYKLLREGYEAFVIFSFMQFLLAYLGGAVPLARRLNMKRRLGYREQRHFFPCSIFLPTWKLGASYVRFTLIGTLQYVPASIVVMSLSLGAWALDVYDEGDWRPTNVYFYCALITNCSQIWAMYCLVMLYHATHDELRPIKPFGKFLSVKLVVFFTFWQSVGIGMLERLEGRGGVLDGMQKGIVADDTQFDDFFFNNGYHDGTSDETGTSTGSHSTSERVSPSEYQKHHDNESFSVALQNFVLCIEMLLFALGHIWAFPADEWAGSHSYLKLDSFDPSHQKRYGHFGYGNVHDRMLRSPSRRSARGDGSSGSIDSEAESEASQDSGRDSTGKSDFGPVAASASRSYSSSPKRHFENSSKTDRSNSPPRALPTILSNGELHADKNSEINETQPRQSIEEKADEEEMAQQTELEQSSESLAQGTAAGVQVLGLSESGASDKRGSEGDDDLQVEAEKCEGKNSEGNGGSNDSNRENIDDENGASIGNKPFKRRLQSVVLGQVRHLGDQIGNGASEAWQNTATVFHNTGQNVYGVAEHQTHQVIDSTKLVGKAMVDVPMGVASTIYDGVGNVARSTVSLPVNIGRAAYDGGTKVRESYLANDNGGEGVYGVVQKTGNVLSAVGDIPVNMARSFGTGVVDIARNTVELPVRTVGSAVGGTVNLANVTSTQVLRNVPLLPPLHKEEFRDGINFSDIWSSIQTVCKLYSFVSFFLTIVA